MSRASKQPRQNHVKSYWRVTFKVTNYVFCLDHLDMKKVTSISNASSHRDDPCPPPIDSSRKIMRIGLAFVPNTRACEAVGVDEGAEIVPACLDTHGHSGHGNFTAPIFGGLGAK
jgi:hypothetical protein